MCSSDLLADRLRWLALNEFTLENVTAALSVTPKSHCRAQSACMFRSRRASTTLCFGAGKKHTLKEAFRKGYPAEPVAFKNLMTHGSAIHIAFRTSLRSSSL